MTEILKIYVKLACFMPGPAWSLALQLKSYCALEIYTFGLVSEYENMFQLNVCINSI